MLEDSRENGRREIELGTARATIRRKESVIHSFSERVCTGFASHMPAPAWGYPDQHEAVLRVVQTCVEYPKRVRVNLGKDVHSLLLWHEGSEVKHGGCTPPHECGDRQMMFMPFSAAPS